MRCEGWTRRGGAFTLGPVEWVQCDEEAVVMVNCTQEGETKDFPACMSCWERAITYPIKINKVIPLKPVEKE